MMKAIFAKNLGKLIAVCGFALGLSLGFNNCAKIQVADSQHALVSRLSAGASVFINSDEVYTNSKNVTLTLINRSAKEMYVTNDPTCQTGGQWEPYSESRPWQLGSENSESKVYTKFRESTGNFESECFMDSIVHDNVPPVMVMVKGPTAFTNQSSSPLQFTASDGLSGIGSFSCFNGAGARLPSCQESMSVTNSTEGAMSMTVRALDRAGNESLPLAMAWVYDKTPPVVSLNSVPSSPTNQTTAIFGFTGKDNNSSPVAFECQVDQEGFKSCLSGVNYSLPSGNHKFTLRGKDEAGNVSEEVIYGWKIDLTAPSVQITSSPRGTDNVALSEFSFVGFDEGVSLSRYECQIDKQGYKACSSPTSYTLAEGNHQFDVRGYDSSGNVSAPATYKWLLDLTLPTVILVDKPAAFTKDASALFTWSADDVGSGIGSTECSLDGASFQTCQISFSSNGLMQGTHEFAVRAKDLAGNISRPARYSWVIDTTKPVVQILSGPAAMSNLPTAHFEMSATDNSPGVLTLKCRLDSEVAMSACDLVKDLSGLGEFIHNFYVQAIVAAVNISVRVVYPWMVDLVGPAITFVRVPPEKSSVLDSLVLEYRVEDQFSGLDLVQCGLGSTVANCPGAQVVNFGSLPAGDYTFQVMATDKVGNKSTNKIQFSVADNTVQTIQDLASTSNNKVDVLVVIDNSGSMQAEQANMAARFSNFFDNLKGLDWQVAIVTTDISADSPLRDGRFIEFSSLPGQYIVTSAMDLNVVKSAFSGTIQRPSNEGSGNEQGIAATYRAIQRSQVVSTTNTPQQAFFRSGSALAVLVVTDADESPGRLGTAAANIPQNLINLVKTTFQQKAFVFHSIVVKSKDSTCLGKDGNESYGLSYETLSALTGGIVGSVCEANYSAQLTNMAVAVNDLVKTVTLKCLPLDINKDGAPDVSFADGSALPAHTLEQLKLTFQSSLPNGNYQLKYTCLK